jgi:hypothetical protein
MAANETKPEQTPEERRRAAAERLRGLFAHVAPGRSLADELIADRRAEVRRDERKYAEAEAREEDERRAGR